MKKIQKASTNSMFIIEKEGIKLGVDIIYNLTTDREKYRLILIKEDGSKSEPMFMTRNKMGSVTELKTMGNCFDGKFIDEVRQEIEGNYKDIPRKYEYTEAYGWIGHIDEETGELGKVRFNGSSIGGSKGYKLIGNEVHLKKHGLSQPLIELINKVVENKPINQILVAATLASAIIGALDIKSLMINIFGMSSRGKTSIMKLCASIWSSKNHNGIFTSWYNTDNALVRVLDGNNGVTVFIDDSSKGERKDYTNVVYQLENGTSKGRLNKLYKIDTQAKWATMIFSSSELSLYAKCDKDKKGLLRRLLEIEIRNGNDLLDNADMAETIKDVTNNNYGNIGMQFVNAIMENGLHDNEFEQLRVLYNEERRNLQSKIGGDGIYQGMAEKLATIMLAAKLTEKFGLGIEFNTNVIELTLLKLMKENSVKLLDSEQKKPTINEAYIEICSYAKRSCSKYDRVDRHNIPVAEFTELAKYMNYEAMELKLELSNIGAARFGVNGSGYSKDGNVEWDNTLNVSKVEGEKSQSKKVISIFKNIIIEGVDLDA
ncbi:MAG TPA: hypothetical protein DCP90_03080 [Clostridiales bacterium]|nr:MAG: hypothetical protein A2Y22_07445 [Clostridiales bacterium GWD2_32_59]HAN09578.1 hypothetical protein [Clostridiales bacterium]